MDKIRVKNNMYMQAGLIAIIVLFAFVLRFVNLGYSNYQGDEIKAMFLKEKNQSSIEFLLSQRKGPGQFLVTRAVQEINPDYTNHFISRFPFAFASLLSIGLFFLFVKNLYNDQIAFFSTFLFATNGIIVGLSRIVQYQSLVFFFSTLTLASLVLALKRPKFQIWGIYTGMISWALAMLSHYDGIFIAPMVIYLIYRWIREAKLESRAKYIHLIISLAISFLLLAIFYIPYANSITQSNLTYLLSRVESNPIKEKTGSITIFKSYQPIFVFYLYLGFAIIGLLYIAFSFLGKKYFRGESSSKIPNLLSNNFFTETLVLILWFLFPYVFLEGVVHDPGTHIYNYLIPLFILIGIGLWFIFLFLNSYLGKYPGKIVLFTGISALIFFLFTQSYSLFVDHSREYPWESEKYLLWNLNIPLEVRLPLFGFPHYRNWEGLNQFLSDRPERSKYISNEKERISEFYLPENKAKTNNVYMIYIQKPSRLDWRISYSEFSILFKNEDPIYTYKKNGQIYSAVFRIPRNYFEK